MNRLKKKLSYNFSSKLQTLGPGSCAINITSQINEEECSGLSYIDLQAMLIGSNEWTKYYDAYKIYKIEQIAVTVYPNDSLNNAPTYINLDWFSTVKSGDGIKKLDSTKIVYNDLKKPKSYFFKPPNMVILGGNPRKFNLRNYLPNAQLYFYQDSGSLRGRVDARIVFKVPTEYTSAKDIKLKKVEKLVKLDENDMQSANLKTINNLRLTGIHENSFSYLPKEKEIPEEEKLEEDDEEENKTIITKKSDLSWSLFDQLVKEEEEIKNKKNEKNKKRREKKKKIKKEMKEKIKKSKLFRKILNKEKDKLIKEAKADATFVDQLKQEKRKQAEEHYQKRKQLGANRKKQKVEAFQENPTKVIGQNYDKREFKRLLLKRNASITKILSLNNSIKDKPTELNKYFKEKEKINRAMQHLKNGKLDERDNSYFGDLKNCQDNLELLMDC